VWIPAPAAPEPVTCPSCHGVVRTCEACGGTGEVEWRFRVYVRNDDCPECGSMRPCRECGGDGTVEPPPVQVGPVLLAAWHLRLIATLPGAELAPRGRLDTVRFRASGGVEGLVMPIREG
jgi:hypothetical protein